MHCGLYFGARYDFAYVPNCILHTRYCAFYAYTIFVVFQPICLLALMQSSNSYCYNPDIEWTTLKLFTVSACKAANPESPSKSSIFSFLNPAIEAIGC